MIGEFYILVDDCVLVSPAWIGTQPVARDVVYGATVSTVFLGMDHIGGLFETMVMGGVLDGLMVRRETAAESRAFHARIVAALNSVNWLEYHLDGNVKDKILTFINSKEYIK